jgi:hypothetical protein
MKIMGMGLDYTGNPIFESMDEDAVINGLVSALERNAEAVQRLTKTTAETVSFRGEVERTTVMAEYYIRSIPRRQRIRIHTE